MTKANHRANIVRVGEILPHPNADRLEITHVEGYQIVTGKDQFKQGDLAVYIQPDSVVPQTEPFRFIWGDYATVRCNNHTGDPTTCDIDVDEVPERRRRITVKRLRKEYSEGLLMPVASLDFQIGQHGEMQGLFFNGKALEVGQDVAELLGVTHYVPEFDRENTKAGRLTMPKRRYPRTLRGWFYWTLGKLGLHWGTRALALEVAFDFPVYDVDALKNHKNWIQPGDIVQVTEKIHGSNARYVYVDGTQYCGSREQWKQDGPNVWWNVFRQFPEIGVWCQENPGKVLYGEVGPTQKGFRYGSGENTTFFFAFDVWDAENSQWGWAGNHGFAPTAPIISVEHFSDSTLKLADGKSVVPGANHIREGVVLRKLDGSGTTLKVVSNAFLEKDSQ